MTIEQFQKEYNTDGCGKAIVIINTHESGATQTPAYELIDDLLHTTIQECYNECLAVECGEGECASAIAEKFPFISRYE